MNKVAVAAAAVLAIVMLALPRVVGSITEANVRERVAAIDASPSVAAELTSFDHGWFRSTARIKLRSEDADDLSLAAGTPLGVFSEMAVVVDFAHGPVAVLDGVHFGWSKVVARPDLEAPDVAALTQTLGVPYLFEFRGRTPYSGGLAFDADAPPWELPVDEGLLKFSGATVAGELAGIRLEADAQIGSVELTSATGTLAVRGVQASADNELRSDYVIPGQASFSIASISIVDAFDPATPTFETTNLRLQGDVDVDAAGERLEVHANLAVDSVRIAENEVTGGFVTLTVRDVDVATVEAYGALASDDAASLAGLLGPHLERALQRGASLALDPIRFRYDGEPFEGRVEVTANPARLPPAGTLTLDNPLLMASAVNTKADLRLSKTLAGRLATLAARMQLGNDPTIPPDQLEYVAQAQSGLLLAMLVGQGVLVEEGEGYRTSLDYTDGSLTLNGNPLPFGFQ